MTKKEGNGKLLVGILLTLVVVFGGLLLLGGDSGDVSTGEVTKTDADSAVSTAPITASVKSGELEFFLRAGNGGTGTTDSKLVLLDSSYAKFDVNGKFDEDATRYGIMATHYNEGITALKAFPTGTPKDISSTSGEWSEAQLVAKKGDKFIVYTYEDTSPAAAENISTVHLMTLNDFDIGNSKWVATDSEGRSYWNLYEYATYDWYNGQDAIKDGYIIDDAGSALSDEPATWYSRATVNDQYAPDLAVYISAPSNFTGKFGYLSVTDKAGHSKKFTSLTKAENYGGTDPINVAATKLSAAAGKGGDAAVWNWYYVGEISNEFLTLNTASDNNRLTWELETDTYGTNVTINVSLLMNSGSPSSNNGAVTIADDFWVQLGDGATGTGASGYFADQ